MAKEVGEVPAGSRHCIWFLPSLWLDWSGGSGGQAGLTRHSLPGEATGQGQGHNPAGQGQPH